MSNTDFNFQADQNANKEGQNNSSQGQNNSGPNFEALLKDGNIWNDPEVKQQNPSGNNQNIYNNNNQFNPNNNSNNMRTEPKSVKEQIAAHLDPYKLTITDEMLADKEILQAALNDHSQNIYMQSMKDSIEAFKMHTKTMKEELLQEFNSTKASETLMNKLATEIPEMNNPLLRPIVVSFANKFLAHGVKQEDLAAGIKHAMNQIGTSINQNSQSAEKSSMRGSSNQDFVKLLLEE